MSTSTVWHVRWNYAGDLTGCGASIDGTADATARPSHLRVLATSNARICGKCLDLALDEPRTAVPAAVAAVVAAAAVVVLLGLGLHTATHRDAPAVAPPVPSPSGERAHPQENAR